ncbi:DNA polymerase [Thermoplasmatales archaeon SG8-52-4]|nr:MAG: DNA polymerase [Thermoplasmatales archaeon SG8-52-4]
MSMKEDMKNITHLINKCKKCDLYKTRNKPVVGEGSIDSNILFIGEAPGHNEDISGKPFVGRAGKIFDELLSSIDMKRNDVFITNILKCRTQNNRNPFKGEIEACTKFLTDQINIIKPKIIVTLGNFAKDFMFKKYKLENEKISKIHSKVFKVKSSYGIVKIIPLYHPAVATYNPNTKSTLLKDFSTIKNNMI